MKVNKKVSRKEWKQRPEIFRIEAVIHDGQWYNFDKWKRVALIKDEKVLLDWINKHKNILIKNNQKALQELKKLK